MIVRSELKRKAKRLLAGNWWSAISMTVLSGLIFNLLILLVGGILASSILVGLSALGYHPFESMSDVVLLSASTVFSIFLYIVLSFLSLSFGLVEIGIDATGLEWMDSKDKTVANVKSAFRYFNKKDAWPVFKLYLLQAIFVFLWGLMPLVGPVIAVVKQCAYSQSAYIYYRRGKELTSLEIITASRRMMDGHKWEYFCLYFSFIGWFLLCLLTVGIGFIWLIPYVTITLAAYYQALEKRVEELASY